MVGADIAAGEALGARERGASRRRARSGWSAHRALRRAAAADEHVVEQPRQLARLAVADPVDLDAGAGDVGAVEPVDPGRGGAQQLRLARHHHDGVQPADRLELDHALAEPALAGIHDLLELGDERLGRGVAHRIDADRLAAHPIGVEAQHGLDRGAALGAAALDQQQIADRIGADGAGLDGKAVEQLDDGLRRHVLQRDRGDAVAGLRTGIGGDAIDAAAADRFAGRHQPIAGGIARQHHVGGAQRAFEHEQDIVLGDRAARRQADGALHARIDGVADAENVAENDLGDGGDRRVLEIELVALAAAAGRRRRDLDRIGAAAAVIARGAQALGRARIGDLGAARKARRQVGAAHPVDRIRRNRSPAPSR